MNTVDVLTPQNVKLELKLATVGQRGAAFVIDQAVFIAYLILVLFALILPFGLSEDVAMFIYIFLVYPVIFFYSLGMELLFHGQSIGKMALGIRVIRLDGEPIGMDEALSRWFLRIVDIYFSIGSLAILMISSGKYNQRFGDILGGTIVIKEKTVLNSVSLSHVMNLDTKDSYEPVYPRARLLKEEEAMLVKTTLSRFESKRNDGTKKAVEELVNKLEDVLEIKKTEKSNVEFLRTLLKDYIVLTR